MSVRHILGFDRDDPELRAALGSGWRRSDLVWERLMETANRAVLDGKTGRARRLFIFADMLARIRFDSRDPRRATAPAARAMLTFGEGRRVSGLRARALGHWANAGAFIATMEIRPRARSSLFHLRMEALHRDTFQSNLRERISRIAAETAETMTTIGAPDHAGHRHFSRWLGERPGVFDDTRKVLSACLLLPDLAREMPVVKSAP